MARSKTPKQLDPRDIARAVAIEVADEPEQVGDVVEIIDLGDCVTDFRLGSHVRGYEGWQWSVTLYHDEEADTWTVNESSLIPTDEALMPPAWVPWKDRLKPEDLAPTDSIGTEPDDPRLEDGFRKTEPVAEGVEVAGGEANSVADPGENALGDSVLDDSAMDDTAALVEEFALSRRHVLSPLGRAQATKRWYEGPRGPKALSTKTAEGNLCSTCGFFVPLKGELNLLFGVCANKWSPDDGRVVSLDHGCGEHSEIEPPEPSSLWVQSKPALDDLRIDVVVQQPREERGAVEALEQSDEVGVDEVSEEDIDENTEIDIDSDDVRDNLFDDDDDTPELEEIVDIVADDDIDDIDIDSIEDIIIDDEDAAEEDIIIENEDASETDLSIVEENGIDDAEAAETIAEDEE